MEMFTKGEWVSSGFAVITELGDVIADCGLSDDPYDAEEKANTHLIAAAPEMYAMLKSIIDPDVNVDSVICGIADLLEKARGE